MGMEELSDEELKAVASGNLESLSDNALKIVAASEGGSSGSPAPEASSITEDDIQNIVKSVIGGPVDASSLDQKAPSEGADLKDFPGTTAAMNYADSATAGLARRGAAGIDALIGKLTGRGNSVIEGADQDLGKLYDKSLGNVTDTMDRASEANPKAAIAGTVGGFVGPGGVFGTAFKGASKAPLIAKLLGSSKFIPKLAGTALRGGTANAIYGQIEEGLNPDLGERGKELAKDFGTGAAFDAGTFAGLKGVKALAGLPTKSAQALKGFFTKATEKIPLGVGDFIKEGRLNKFSDKVDDLAKEAGAGDKEVAGQQVASKMEGIKGDVLDKYNKLTSKVIGRFGDQNVSAETLRKGIVRELEGLGAMDSKGNIIDNSILAKFDPELKNVVSQLASFSEELASNPTLADMDRVVKGMGKLAKFNSGNRGTKEQIFGSLFNDARESLLEGIDDVVTRSGERTSQYTGATKEAGRLKGVVSSLDQEAAQPFKGEGVLQNIAESKGQNLQKLDQVSALIDDLDSANAVQGASAKEGLRAARKMVSKNLEVAKGPIGKLTDKYPEEVISRARGTGKLNLGSVVDEALSANEAYRDPIKQAVMADIVDHAKDPKALKKIMDVYDDVIPQLFDDAEIQNFQKLAGTFKKAPGKASKGASFLLNRLQGGTPKPDVLETLPRTGAPWINLIMGRQSDERAR